MNVKRAAFQTVGTIDWAACALVCGIACDHVDPNLIRELTQSDPGQDHSKGDPEIGDDDAKPIPPDTQPEAFS